MIRCQHCQRVITSPAYRSGGRLRQRKFCDQACFEAHCQHKVRCRTLPGRPPRLDGAFPYADSDRLDEAPPCCLKCGGLWRRVDEGYGCRQCGTRWRAAECLRALLGRPLFQADRFPVTRLGPRRGL